jgi:hypothetical protein
MSFNYYYIFHLYRFAYYAEYKKLIKSGMEPDAAKSAATAAAEAAVKSAHLPYDVQHPSETMPSIPKMEAQKAVVAPDTTTTTTTITT